MPPHLRRRGSGLLQIPKPGLLPSPNCAGLGPLGPSRVVLSTRPSSCSLRPAALLLLASTPGSHPTSENLLPRSSGGLRGRDLHPLVDWPSVWAHHFSNFRGRPHMRPQPSKRARNAVGSWIGVRCQDEQVTVASDKNGRARGGQGHQIVRDGMSFDFASWERFPVTPERPVTSSGKKGRQQSLAQPGRIAVSVPA